MELDIFFKSIDEIPMNDDVLGFSCSIYNDDHFPNWEDSDIVLFGVQEDRKSFLNSGSAKGQYKIRSAFYNLFSTIPFKIADLGDIIQGNTIDDTIKAVAEVTKELIAKGKFVILLGGSQDLTYANYLGYEQLEQVVNLVSIDNCLDITANEQEEFNCSNYLNKIVLHQPNYLFNFSQIGFQGFFVKKDQLELLESLYFDYIRLGDIQNDISICEPILRNADILSVDLKSIRKSEFKSSNGLGPNGLFANEICQLMKYSGMSDKLSSVGIYEYNPDLDVDGAGALLVAQMIYFIITGFYSRKGDYPCGLKSENLKYVVHHDEIDHSLIFYKSPKSNRWWLEVPYPPRNDFKFERHHLVPCSYQDYELAMNENIPDVWWKTYRKLN